MKILYVPCKTESDAMSISRRLIEEKLAICVNIFNSKSIFEWRKKIETTTEYVMIVKTTSALQAAASKRIKALHPYKTPAIIVWDAESNPEYLLWMNGQFD